MAIDLSRSPAQMSYPLLPSLNLPDMTPPPFAAPDLCDPTPTSSQEQFRHSYPKKSNVVSHSSPSPSPSKLHHASQPPSHSQNPFFPPSSVTPPS
ncbi:hypothetical protein TIFTF001_016834 [Ficus carica]|uniref:Uncharacterized protein n=1 Tax=Ficus carica TaxID=3494 RepID=A0AA88AK74_FICCA|nr:hypothetical protein TIFTF001_016834 [Ficus carica]